CTQVRCRHAPTSPRLALLRSRDGGDKKCREFPIWRTNLRMTSGRAAAHSPWAKTRSDTPDSSDPAVQSLAVIKRIADKHRLCYFAECPFRGQRSWYRLPIRACELPPEVGRRRGIGTTPIQVRTPMVTTEGGHASASSGGGAATFADFLRRVCAGDEAAATELVQRYEPALRLEVQLRLTDPKLRRLL